MSKCPVCGKDYPSCKGDVFVIPVDKLKELDVMSRKGECRNLEEALLDYVNMLNYKKIFEQLRKDYLARLEDMKCFEQLKRDYNKRLEQMRALRAKNKSINDSRNAIRTSLLQKKEINNEMREALHSTLYELRERERHIQRLESCIRQFVKDNDVDNTGLATIPERIDEGNDKTNKTLEYPVLKEMTNGVKITKVVKNGTQKLDTAPDVYAKQRNKNKNIIKNPMITSMMSKRMTKEILKK